MTMSNLNSTSTVTWEDFLSQIPRFSGFSDSKQLTFIKCIGVVYGVAVMGMAYAVGMLPGITESSMLVTSATSGPLLGVFILAMLFPCANWKGASIGMLTSHAVTLWITFGSLTIHKHIPQLPLSVDGCNNATFGSFSPSPPDWFGARSGATGNYNATPITASLVEIDHSRDALSHLYSVSYMYYSLIGCGLTVLLGVVLSYILGSSPDDAFDEMLIHPVALRLSRLLPGKARKYVSDPVRKPAATWVPTTVTATNEKQPQST